MIIIETASFHFLRAVSFLSVSSANFSSPAFIEFDNLSFFRIRLSLKTIYSPRSVKCTLFSISMEIASDLRFMWKRVMSYLAIFDKVLISFRLARAYLIATSYFELNFIKNICTM